MIDRGGGVKAESVSKLSEVRTAPEASRLLNRVTRHSDRDSGMARVEDDIRQRMDLVLHDWKLYEKKGAAEMQEIGGAAREQNDGDKPDLLGPADQRHPQ